MGLLGFLFGNKGTRDARALINPADAPLSTLNGRKSEKRGQERPSTELSISPFAVIEGKVIAAFSKVKQDITLLSSWVKYLKHKDLLHEQRHTKTQRELGEHKTLISGLKAEAAEIKAAIKQLQEHKERSETGSFPNLIRTKSELNPDRKRTYFENKVVTAIRSRLKDYILKQILELAAKETHSTREIEEIIVGEKALCGRTAFYDYLRELKHKRMIRHSEKGSKKVVVAEKAGLEEVR
ncbi:hypothetical protein HYV85_03715 [Candidatus Woesearchaeota archaeon]|nr:hypothetical protein [Candidatus Woesearchaeota archaeon]